jgi:Tfp pilus assembly protein FimV
VTREFLPHWGYILPKNHIRTFTLFNQLLNKIIKTDTYLAYGKYDEAEKSLRQELKVSPYKDSYKLKLLEVFYSSENNEAFDDFI